MFISSWLEQISKEARSAQLINKDHVILKASEEVSNKIETSTIEASFWSAGFSERTEFYTIKIVQP